MDVKAFFQKEGIRFRKEKNQYFSSINNQENQLHYLVSGVCALVRFTKNGEEIIYHYFKEGDVILIDREEIYFWEGNCKIIMICTPPWYKEQCELIKE